MVEIVAEISGNHKGVLSNALALIWTAADCGCDYAKFQYYRPEDMPDARENDNHAMYQKLAVRPHWLPLMFECARSVGIGLFASVFSVETAKELLEYDMPYIKIASPVSTKLPDKLYESIADVIPRHVGLIVSSDSRHAEKCGIGASGEGPLKGCIVHPDTPKELIDEDYSFGWHHSIEGFSDHSAGISAPLSIIREFPATVRMIEKHFRLKDDNDCEDAEFSADPKTMQLLCRLAHNNK